MAWAHIASVSAGSSDGISVTTGNIDTSGANLLLASVADYNAESAVTLTDSKGNTWTPLTPIDGTSLAGREVRFPLIQDLQ
jgi:hypothetical protein